MARAAPSQTSFFSGELSPLVAGRVETDEYKQGLGVCLGFIPLAQGGVTAAPGTAHVAAAKDSTSATRVVRFEFSTEQAYIIEFGNLYCRFYKDDARIENPPGTAVEIETPYTAAQIFDLQFTQSADVLYITHVSHAQRRLIRLSHTEWILEIMAFLDGPYLPTNSTLDTITPATAAYDEIDNPSNLGLNAVAHSGALYCAVGAVTGSGAYIATSPDGANWTLQANPKNFALHAITWDGSQFVAVGGADGTDAYIATSPDGIAWTERANPKNFTLYGIAWSGYFFTAVGGADGTDAYIITSADGITWAEQANPKNFTLYGIVWASNKWIAVGAADGTDAYILSSSDAITWTENTNPKNFALYGIVWSGADAIAVGAADGTNAYMVGAERVTLTASRAIFSATDVGRHVRIKHASTWGSAIISEFVSPWVVNVKVGSAFGATTASTFWRLGVWSETTGYPRTVGFYEDRLIFAGVPNYPQRLDGSNSGDYQNFAPSETDDTVISSNAVSFTLGSREINAILWLMDDEKALVVGTPGGPWLIRPSTAGEALSPTNASGKRLKSYGSANVPAVHLGDSVTYVQRGGRKLRAINYGSTSLDGFSTPDLTLSAEHITRGGITDMAVQMSPQPILWMVRGDGVLVGMTFVPTDDSGKVAVGWHRHIRGGAFGAGHAVVESVAVIPSTDGTRDQLWMVVKRTVNGVTLRTIEYMKKIFDDGDDVEDAFFVDCGVTYDGAATTTVSGLDHLEGEVVSVLADGSAHPDKTVASGQITLDREASVVQVGLAFLAQGQSMRFDMGAQNGTSQGKTQRIHRVAFRVHSTAAMSTGPSFDFLDEYIFRTSSDPTDTAIPPYTGDAEVPNWDSGYGTDERICFVRDKPMPLTLLAVFPQLTTEDRN